MTRENKTEVLRRYIRRNGPCSAQVLGNLISRSSGTATSLLSYDVRHGRIEKYSAADGTMMYAAVNPIELQIENAKKFLERNGYKVQRARKKANDTK